MSSSPITITVSKSSSQSSGVYLYKDEKDRILVNSIFSGVFENTDLKPYMEIVSVNGISCHGMTDVFVKSLLDDAGGEVTVVAQEPVYAGTVMVEEEINLSSNPLPTAPSPSPVHATVVPQPVTPNTTTTSVMQQQQQLQVSTGSSNPPKGCANGGVWRRVAYAGNTTAFCCCILCLLFGVFSLCGAVAYMCPQDEMDVYVVNGKVS